MRPPARRVLQRRDCRREISHARIRAGQGAISRLPLLCLSSTGLGSVSLWRAPVPAICAGVCRRSALRSNLNGNLQSLRWTPHRDISRTAQHVLRPHPPQVQPAPPRFFREGACCPLSADAWPCGLRVQAGTGADAEWRCWLRSAAFSVRGGPAIWAGTDGSATDFERGAGRGLATARTIFTRSASRPEERQFRDDAECAHGAAARKLPATNAPHLSFCRVAAGIIPFGHVAGGRC